MMPNWETIQAVWPLILGLAGLWARIEVALSKASAQSKQNEREVAKLEMKVEAQACWASAGPSSASTGRSLTAEPPTL
jgi:hypothetical protein